MKKKLFVLFFVLVFLCIGCTRISDLISYYIGENTDISNAKITVVAGQKYTGKGLTPSPVIMMDGKVLVEGADYTLDYIDNIEVGEATIIVSGVGSYKGSGQTRFKIVKSNPEAVITCVNEDYTGKSQVIAYCSGGKAANVNKTNAGVYKVTCKGDKNHSNAKSRECVVNVVDISETEIAKIAKQEYTGSEIKPTVEITYGESILVQDTDYTLSYVNNVEPGTATVVIKGIGNFTGTTTVDFSINSSNNAAVITCINRVYNGEAQVIATCSGGTLENEVQTESGKYKVSCKGDSTHKDATDQRCSIEAASIKNATVSGIAPQTYTGEEIEPSPVVTLNGKLLVRNKDYKLSYKSNKEVGNALIIITGIDNYSGIRDASFKIVDAESPKTQAFITCSDKQYTGEAQVIATCSGGTIENAIQTEVGQYLIKCKGDSSHANAAYRTCSILHRPLSGASISKIAPQTYTGKPIKPSVSVTLGGKHLKKGKDYEVTYNNNTKAGYANVVISGINNYIGKIATGFEIVKPKEEKTPAIITCMNKYYNGSHQVIASCSGGKISGEKQSEVGSHKITCKGDETHFDAPSVNCTITKASIVNAVIKPIKEQIYTGKEIKPKPVVEINGIELVKDIDYTVGYRNNVDAGTGIITITGKGNYVGVATTSFVINKAADEITIIMAEATYSNSEINAASKSKSGSRVILTYYSDSECKKQLSTAPINAGTYYATATSQGSLNYNKGKVGCSKVVLIKKAKDVLTLQEMKTITYNESYGTVKVKSSAGLQPTIIYYTDSACTQKTGTPNSFKTGGAPKNAGEYYISATTPGNENYKNGSLNCVKAITIEKASIKVASVSEIATQTYTGKEITPEPILTSDHNLLRKGVDYTLSYKNNIKVGTATITIKGKGNYTGSVDKNFQIGREKSKAIITCLDKEYNGENQIIASCSGGTVKNARQINVGEYKIDCAGDKDHLKADTVTCRISTANIKNATIKNVKDVTYCGNPIVQDLVITFNNQRLVQERDYTLSYAGNFNVGTATITVKGIGNYSGSKTKTFEITKKNDTIKVNLVKKTYGAAAVYANVSTTSNVTPTITYYSDEECKVQTTTANAIGNGGAPKKVGNYYITVSTQGNNNYNKASLGCTEAVNISKVSDSIRVNSVTSAYNGNGISTTASTVSKSAVTFVYYNDSLCNEPTTTANAVSNGGAPRNVGKYYAIATTPESTNYLKTSSPCSLAVTINKAPDVFYAQVVNVTYSPDEKGVSAKISVASKSKVTVKYYSTSNCNKETTTANAVSKGGAPKTAGSYYVQASSEGNNNYMGASFPCSPAVNINKASDAFTIKEKVVNYSSSISDGVTATISSTSGSIINSVYYTDESCNKPTTTSNAVTAGGPPNKPGSYYVIATTLESKNYLETSSKCTLGVTINPVVTFYGATVIETGITDGVVLPGSEKIPERRTVDLSLVKRKQYVVSFDYKLNVNTSETNKFNVDIHPDNLPQGPELTATKDLKHYDWTGIVSSDAQLDGPHRLRFYDDDNAKGEKDIIVSNIVLGTVEKKSIAKGATFGTLSITNPKLAGYTFDGWYKKNSDGTETKVTSDTVVNGSISVYARFKKKAKDPFVIESIYDYIVSDINVVDYGADKTGKYDSSDAFNLALRKARSCLQDGTEACGKNATGVVYVPMGRYKITKPLQIYDGISLVGYLPKKKANGTEKLIAGDTTNGSVLMIYGGKDSTSLDQSALRLGTQTQVKNLAFWYPEQSLKTDGTYHQYPPTILQTAVEGVTLENILLINSYTGIDLANYNVEPMWGKALQVVKDIYGSPLSLGLVNDVNLDTIKIENVQFSPKYWSNSGVPNAPTTQTLTNYLIGKKATALLLKRVDWYMLANIKVDGYYYGIHLGKSTDSKVASGNATAEGVIYDSSLTNCFYPIYSETVHHTAITKTELVTSGGTGAALYVAVDAPIALDSCTINTNGSKDNAIITNSIEGMSIVKSVVDGKITKNKSNSKGITFVGNTLRNTGYESINHNSKVGKNPEDISYTSKKSMKVGSKAIKVVNATKNADITSKIKAMITELGSEGGIVYIPAGEYKMSGPVTVPSKVEVRGSTPLAHYGGGTIINTSYYGGPLFTLSAYSGLNGLTIKYPQVTNPYDSKWKDYQNGTQSTNSTKTFAIRGAGKNVFVANIAILNAWSGIDLKSARCDNHYVEHIWGVFLEKGIAVGSLSENGIIRDNHFTINVMSKDTQEGYTNNLKYMLENEAAFVVQESKNEILLNNFVFGAKYGFFIANSTNSNIINGGADSSIQGLRLRGTITNGEFVNMMLVTKPDEEDGKIMDKRTITFKDNGKQVVKVYPNVDLEENSYIMADDSFKGYGNIVNAMLWGNNRRIAYNLNGAGKIEITGGIMDNGNADKSFVKANVSNLLIAGTIFRKDSGKEFTNSKANSSSNYIGPLCYDGKCNVNKTNSTAAHYLKDSCIAK